MYYNYHVSHNTVSSFKGGYTMSNYFDNQSNWSWTVTNNSISVTTDHGDHTHTLDLNNATFGDMLDNGDKTMGDAHRAASHDKK